MELTPREGKGYPIQYSGLWNFMDCILHEVAKSPTWLSDFHFTKLTCFATYCKRVVFLTFISLFLWRKYLSLVHLLYEQLSGTNYLVPNMLQSFIKYYKHAWNAGYPASIPGSGRSPGEGNGNPLHIIAWKIPWMERSLVGYSPRGRKESDTTERLHLSNVTFSTIRQQKNVTIFRKFTVIMNQVTI